MSYKKQNWIDHIEDYETGEIFQEGTLFTAKRMNHIEDGIYQASSEIEDITLLSGNDLAIDITRAINSNKRLRVTQDVIEFNELFKFTGTGKEVLELEFNPKSLITSNYAGTEKKPIFHFENLKTIKITNMSIDYIYPPNDETMINLHHLLSITNCENVIIDNCKFTRSHFAGLYINGCGKVTITNTQATHNYFGGILYANCIYVLVDGCNLSYNGWTNYPNKGYGIAQELGQPSCKTAIITNCNCSNNVRKGIDCHEFDNAIISNNYLEGNGIYGIALIAGSANAESVIVSNNIVLNQPESTYEAGSGISVESYESYTINNISITNNIVNNIHGNGILVGTNSAHNMIISNNTVEYIYPVYKGLSSTTSCVRIKEVVNPCYTVKIIGNILKSQAVHGILVERCTKLYVENNSIKNENNSCCLMFPDKAGNSAKVEYAIIKGNSIFCKSNYFIAGWNLKTSNGLITENRHVDYVFSNNVITNSDGSTYPLWEQSRGTRTMMAPFTQTVDDVVKNVPYEGDWKVGDRIFVLNNLSEGYIGKVCTTSGTPGTWKYFGKVETT